MPFHGFVNLPVPNRSQAVSDRRMLWLQLSGVKWGLVPGRGVNSDTVQWGLIMREGPKIEEI
jgi:hypothetical protein